MVYCRYNARFTRLRQHKIKFNQNKLQRFRKVSICEFSIQMNDYLLRWESLTCSLRNQIYDCIELVVSNAIWWFVFGCNLHSKFPNALINKKANRDWFRLPETCEQPATAPLAAIRCCHRYHGFACSLNKRSSKDQWLLWMQLNSSRHEYQSFSNVQRHVNHTDLIRNSNKAKTVCECMCCSVID